MISTNNTDRALPAKLRELSVAVQAMAAIGAELRLRQSGEGGDPLVRSQLRNVVDALEPSLLEGAGEPQTSVAIASIQLLFRYALDFLEHPGRQAQWNYSDPSLLQLQGMLSRGNVTAIERLCNERPDLQNATHSGTFLDVGTGVGALAIEAAKTWPDLRVVGIDTFEPALALARLNIAEDDAGSRIELRNQNVLNLSDRDAFTLAWLPAPFIPRDDFVEALERVFPALKRGGWLIIGQYAIPDEPLARELARLQIVRSGGYPWTTEMLLDLLRGHGYVDAQSAPGFAGAELVLGRRPGS